MVITVNALGNLSFLSLLGSMIFYWVGVAFEGFTIQQKTDSVDFKTNGTLPLWGSAFGGKEYTSSTLVKKNIFSIFGRYSIIASNILLALLLILRWKESGHFPLSNLYESLMFLSWCFTGLHLFFFSEDKALSSGSLRDRSDSTQSVDVDPPLLSAVAPGDTSDSKFKDFTSSADQFLGAITTPSALFTNAFATFTLPKEMQEVSPLVPALQSNWLMMHVTVMILSYAALILGSLLSIAYLIVTFNSETEKTTRQPNLTYSTQSQSVLSTNQTILDVPQASGLNDFSLLDGIRLNESKTTSVNTKKQKLAWVLDNLSYRILGIGFPFLTIGILSGAVWANEAWGSYWSWDPKETWALLTWLIFAIYLHIRLNKGWEGKKPAIIASFGFVIVWICYLGVNLIGEGLHSYGWLSQS